MDIPFRVKGKQMNVIEPNAVSQMNLLPKKNSFEPILFILECSIGLLLGFFCLVSTSFAAGSLQGAFINAGDKPTAYRTFVKDVSERVLLPSYDAFSLQSKHLSQATERFCHAERTSEQFTQVKDSWNITKQAWAQTLPFRFGPALDNFLDLKIQFWPDDKNLVRKQVKGFLRTHPSPSVAELAKAASPAQGLSAIEYLLFDAEEGGISTFTEGESRHQRCDYLKAAAQHLSQQSQDLLKAWGNANSGYLAEFSYSENQAVIDESFAVILRESLVSIEVIKNLKVGKPFGLHVLIETGKINAFFLESWRSQSSQENIISSLITFQQMYYGGSHFGLDDLLINNFNQPELEFILHTQISKCLKLAYELPKPIFSQVGGLATQKKAGELHGELVKLIAMIKQSLSQTLGITIGFSSNDGD